MTETTTHHDRELSGESRSMNKMTANERDAGKTTDHVRRSGQRPRSPQPKPKARRQPLRRRPKHGWIRTSSSVNHASRPLNRISNFSKSCSSIDNILDQCLHISRARTLVPIQGPRHLHLVHNSGKTTDAATTATRPDIYDVNAQHWPRRRHGTTTPGRRRNLITPPGLTKRQLTQQPQRKPIYECASMVGGYPC